MVHARPRSWRFAPLAATIVLAAGAGAFLGALTAGGFAHHLPASAAVAGTDTSPSLKAQLAELTAAFEERYLRRALKRTRAHIGRTARLTGLSRRTITEKLALYQIDKNEFKKD